MVFGDESPFGRVPHDAVSRAIRRHVLYGPLMTVANHSACLHLTRGVLILQLNFWGDSEGQCTT
jgi:hypothetical protein